MNNSMLLLAAGVCSAMLLSGPAMLLLRRFHRDDAFAARVEVARGVMAAGPPALALDGRTAAIQLVAGLGLTVIRSGLLSARTLRDLEQTLVTAGFRAESALGLFVGSKLVLTPAALLVAWLALPGGFSLTMRCMLIAGSAVAGLLAPDYLVRRLRVGYSRKLERGLPDALDLLVVCAQAGLSLEPAINRVAEEIRPAHAEVANELALTSNEMQVMADSRAALLRLGERTGLESLRRLSATLAQSMQYGTPLSDAMRGLAAEMRQDMLIAFEERAARLPVLLTMPMILFILPSLMMVVGGPAVIQVLKVLSH
jgi:tight adherence protein C